MTVGQKLARQGCSSGFTWLRLALALGIFTFHSITIRYGSANAIPPLLAALARLILPMFFAMSGFLVAASLARSPSLIQFITFRVLRLGPGLAVVVLASMLVMGPLVTTINWRAYFHDGQLYSYLGNIVAQPRYGLPGVFKHNPRPGIVNGSVWTIPAELWCYLLLLPAFHLGIVRHRRILATASLCVLLIATLGFFLRYPWFGGLPTSDLLLPFAAGVVMFAVADWISLRAALAVPLLGIALLAYSSPHWSALGALPLAYGTVWLGLRALPSPPGDYSYGLYLVGYPLLQVFVALLPGGPWWITWAASLPAAMICAALLWHQVEKPLLAQKARFVPRSAWTERFIYPKAAAAFGHRTKKSFFRTARCSSPKGGGRIRIA